MAKTSIMQRLKASIFSGAANEKKGRNRRVGLWYGLIAAVIATALQGSGALHGLHDYLTAVVFQYNYDTPELLNKYLIVKKDQATSELLGQNPGREEFTSIINFLGNSQLIKRSGLKNREKKQRVFTLSIGYFDNLKSFPIKSSFNSNWWSFSANGSPIYAKRKKLLPGEKRQTYFSFFKFEDRLWFFPGGNVFKALASQGRKSFVGATVLRNWASSSILETEVQRLLEGWELFFLNIIYVYPEIRFNILPYSRSEKDKDKGILFEFSFFLNKPGNPIQYFVDPSSVIAFDFVLQGEKDTETDRKLVEAIADAQSKVILAGHTKLEEVFDNKEIEDIASGTKTATKIHKFYRTKLETRRIMPHKKFIVGNAKTAMIDMSVGNKSYITNAPMYIPDFKGKKLDPSFGLLTAMLAMDHEQKLSGPSSYYQSMLTELERIYPEVASGTFKGPLVIRDFTIPVNPKGQMLIDFIGSTSKGAEAMASFKSASFYECFTTDLLKKFFKKFPDRLKLKPTIAHSRTLDRADNKGMKICMVGPFESSDFDFYPTPLSLKSPFTVQAEPLMGIEIHANVVANILERRMLKHPSYFKTILFLFILCLALGYLLDVFTPLFGAIVTGGFVAVVSWYAFFSYHSLREVFDFSAFLFAFPATWIMATLTNYFRQRARAKNTKDMFSRFVAADVVQYMLENPELVKPGGQKVELTIFFSDVAGFTSISEALTPEELVVLLNEYLGAMTDLLFKYGGTLDKFIGDAVMAFWNYPKKQEDHALKACLCAIEMQKKITELQKGWAKRGLPEVSARAGLNSADVVVGYMGSMKAQMNFTCMGDGVNLASRLEGANKEYGTDLMISDATYQQVKDKVTTRFLDFLAVKGKKEPVKVHHLVCEKGDEPPGWDDLAELYDKGIQLHLDRKWDEAIATFEELLEKWPEDGPSKTYIKRCNEYKVHPPPENWDGRYILTHK